MRVIFTDKKANQEWSYDHIAAVPGKGERVFLNSAPKGVLHVVDQVTHHIGGVEHTLFVRLERLLTDYDPNEER